LRTSGSQWPPKGEGVDDETPQDMRDIEDMTEMVEEKLLGEWDSGPEIETGKLSPDAEAKGKKATRVKFLIPTDDFNYYEQLAVRGRQQLKTDSAAKVVAEMNLKDVPSTDEDRQWAVMLGPVGKNPSELPDPVQEPSEEKKEPDYLSDYVGDWADERERSEDYEKMVKSGASEEGTSSDKASVEEVTGGVSEGAVLSATMGQLSSYIASLEALTADKAGLDAAIKEVLTETDASIGLKDKIDAAVPQLLTSLKAMVGSADQDSTVDSFINEKKSSAGTIQKMLSLLEGAPEGVPIRPDDIAVVNSMVGKDMDPKVEEEIEASMETDFLATYLNILPAGERDAALSNYEKWGFMPAGVSAATVKGKAEKGDLVLDSGRLKMMGEIYKVLDLVGTLGEASEDELKARGVTPQIASILRALGDSERIEADQLEFGETQIEKSVFSEDFLAMKM